MLVKWPDYQKIRYELSAMSIKNCSMSLNSIGIKNGTSNLQDDSGIHRFPFQLLYKSFVLFAGSLS